MQIKYDENFKDDACVLVCGKKAYVKYTQRDAPMPIKGLERNWTLEITRPGFRGMFPIGITNQRVHTVNLRRKACVFLDYNEALEVAKGLLDTGNFSCVRIIENLYKAGSDLSE